MKNTITLILLLLTTAFYSQNGRVGGIVADSAENGPIPGATVFLKSATFSQGKATNDRGMFFFDSVPFGLLSVFSRTSTPQLFRIVVLFRVVVRFDCFVLLS